MPNFTHLDEHGSVRMVDVSEKEPTLRCARAQGLVSMNSQTFERLLDQRVKKGNVLETARIAGIMGCKRTSELIPMCHPIHITHVKIDFSPITDKCAIRIEAEVRALDQTGVEMEALTAVSAAALTIYDMCKSYDRKMVVSDIWLMEKSGGKSGIFKRA